MSFNSEGLRGSREFSFDKPEGVTRIAILGDSMTEGLQVDDEDVIHEILQRRYGDRFEFLNFSVQSTGLAQHLVTYARKIRPYDVDLVLYFVTTNDLNDSYDWRSPINDERWYHPTYTVDDEGRLRAVEQDLDRFERYESSRRSELSEAFRASGAHRIWRGLRRALKTREAIERDRAEQSAPDHTAEERKRIRTYRALCREMMRRLETDLIVVQTLLVRDFDSSGPAQVVEAQREAWEDSGAEYHHPVAEAISWMQEKNAYRYPFLSWECDGHYSPMGHAFLADYAASLIDQRMALEPASGVAE